MSQRKGGLRAAGSTGETLPWPASNLLQHDVSQRSARSTSSRATLVIIVAAPISGRLADRVGPRPLIVAGMVLLAVSLYIQTHISASSGYGLLLPAFMVMGLGIGLTMSPMSTVAMNAVSADKAGAASGVLSMSRMVGGTFGIAVLSALFQSLASSRLEKTLSGLPISPAQRESMVENLASGGGARLDGLDPALTGRVAAAGRDAFLHAFSNGMLLSTAVAVAGIAVAAMLIRPAGSRVRESAEHHAAEAAAEAPA